MAKEAAVCEAQPNVEQYDSASEETNDASPKVNEKQSSVGTEDETKKSAWVSNSRNLRSYDI